MAETVAGLKGGAAGEMMEGAGKDDNRVVTSRAIWRGGKEVEERGVKWIFSSPISLAI